MSSTARASACFPDSAPDSSSAPDGVIVTNAHVVAGANTISVAMRDGTTYPARLLGKDETNDIAVLKIDAKGLPVAPLGQSDDLIIGEWVIAIGNPYGFLLGNSEPSVTVGVISGTGRNLVARSRRLRDLRRHDPDGCVDQPRQQRRPARECARRDRRG